MSSSLFRNSSSEMAANMNPQAQSQADIMSRFQHFLQAMQGRDPAAMLRELMSSGRYSRDNVAQAERMAKQFMPLFSKFFK